MKILAVDTSATAASVAVMSDSKLLAASFTNTGLTHSQTLMPMVEGTLRGANTDIDEIDLFAVNNGPGSFTGVRIGVAAVKGMAHISEKKCIEISTLESLAYNLVDTDCIAVCAMDARCNQVYTALFRCENGTVTRMCEDKAVLISELEEDIKGNDLPVMFVGDGAKLCYEYYKEKIPCRIAGEKNRYQSAVSTALCAYLKGDDAYISAQTLMPSYLRLPQAQRELKKKLESKEIKE